MLNIFLLGPVVMGLFGAEFSRPGEFVNGWLVGTYPAAVTGFLWVHTGRKRPMATGPSRKMLSIAANR
jgi:hypothetical protein